MKVCSIIPARGGSKRIPFKNISALNNEPLIKWTIRHSLRSKYVDKTYVSTNSEYIKFAAINSRHINCNNDIYIIDRPDELCGDKNSTEEAIKHWLDQLEEKPDIIVLLQCTAPFRGPTQIDDGIQKLIKMKADSLFYACELGRWIWTSNDTPINYDYKNRAMTQDKKWELIECSDYIFTRTLFEETGLRLGGKIVHQKVNKLYSIDIDESIDLKIANAVAKELNLKP